jgi:membrane fusion protein, multidrug efflux system
MEDAVEPGPAVTPPAPVRRRRWLVLLPLAVPAAVLGGVWFALPQLRPALSGLASPAKGGSPIAGSDTFRGVRVMTVRLAEQRSEKRFTGVVAARYEAQVGFRVAGKIAARLVDVGQSVRAGDVLMTLDDADSRSALRAAIANQAAAAAQKSQAVAEEARQARLLEQGWTTRAAYERVLAAARGAEEQVKSAAEQAELARNALGYTRLVAPQDGIVTAIRAEAGQVVAQGQPVLTLVRPGDREALVAIPEGQVGDLTGWLAQASFWARGDTLEPAILREVSPQADPASRTHAVRFELPRSAATADLGATVTLTLQRRTGALVAALPTSAVFFRDGQATVWRVREPGDRLEGIPVSIVTLGADRAIVAGLAAGDRVVTLGVHRLDDRATVRIVEDTSVAGGPR